MQVYRNQFIMNLLPHRVRQATTSLLNPPLSKENYLLLKKLLPPEKEPEKFPQSKDDILHSYQNRNPRNLEMLRLARKPSGYTLEDDRRQFWYRLYLDQVRGSLRATLEHNSGKIVLSASTNDWCLRSRLPSIMNVNAARILGQVFARRCLESGFNEMATEIFTQVETSEKVKAFLQAIQDGGVKLKEGFQIHEVDTHPLATVKPTLPWQVSEDIELKRYEEYGDDLPQQNHVIQIQKNYRKKAGIVEEEFASSKYEY